MSSSSLHHQYLQRRVLRTLLLITGLILVIGVPLVLLDELRLDVAHQLNLAPGKDVEQLADGDEDAILVVVPLGEYTGVGRERYTYRADYIGRSSDAGMRLSDIETGEEIDIPLKSLDHIASDPDGAHILFRGPGDGNRMRAVVLTTATNTVEMLPESQQEPNLPGQWEVATWEKVTGTCDRISPGYRFIACFNRADAASYLAGDWQVDVQLYGEFQVSEPVYRGLGFLLPTLGFAHDDTWLYFQNEHGIYRVEIPESLQEQQPAATPPGEQYNS